jgi:hypothetical protein
LREGVPGKGTGEWNKEGMSVGLGKCCHLSDAMGTKRDVHVYRYAPRARDEDFRAHELEELKVMSVAQEKRRTNDI